MSLLSEVLASTPLPGSLELLGRLLETLGKVMQSSTAQDDLAYLQQLLMTAIENISGQIEVRYGCLLFAGQVMIF